MDGGDAGEALRERERLRRARAREGGDEAEEMGGQDEGRLEKGGGDEGQIVMEERELVVSDVFKNTGLTRALSRSRW